MDFIRDKSFIGMILAVMSIKVFLYYSFMEVTSNFFFIYALTIIYMVGFFITFNNKKFLAIIYFAFSILMLMDSAYYSYFNRNLSLNMIEAVSLLGDVKDSIFKILRPKFLLLILDNIAFLFYCFISEKKSNHIIGPNTVYRTKYKHVITIGMLVILTLTILNPGQGDFITSIKNQEFFSYHAKDIVTYLRGGDSMAAMVKVEGNYENELDGKYFGIAKNRNLIVLQVESLQDFVIGKTYQGQEITPNLNQLIHNDSFYFNHYFQQIGSGNTSDAEFTTNNSLHGSFKSYTYSLYTENYFHGLPWILKDKGYKTMAFHGYKKDFWNREGAYPSQGFDEFIHEEDYTIEESIGFGLSDMDFFEQTIDYLKVCPQPFYGFLVTLSNHHPYEIPNKYKTLTLKEEDEGTLFGNYLQSVNYTDRAIGRFIEQLKENNLYDNTIIAIYGDHFGLNYKEEEIHAAVSDFLGYKYDYDEMLNIPLFIHIPGLKESKTIETVGGHIDFLPTIAYLIGVEKLETLYFGRNLINADTGFVASQTYMVKGSFIEDNIIFEMSKDGIFGNSRAWDIRTKQPVDLELCREGYIKAANQINLANFYLENDVLGKVLKENMSLDEILGKGKDVAKENVFIANSGGDEYPEIIPNTQESLDLSYEEGAKYIEIDIEWTSDDQPVLIHDWNESIEKYFQQEEKQYSLEAFKNFKMINGSQQMTLEDLVDWVREHSDVFIVTNAKRNNIEFLKIIKEKYPDIKERFIPQIYLLDEFTRAEYLGFQKIIVRINNEPLYTNKEILDFVKLNNVFAIVVPVEKVQTDYKALLNLKDKCVYVYTVNDIEEKRKLEKKGVVGFFTEKLKMIQ